MQRFRPPTLQALSEEAIGTVPQRRLSVHHSCFSDRGTRMHTDQEQQSDFNEPDWISLERGNMVSVARRPLTMQEVCAITDQKTMSELHSIMKNLRERRKIIQRRHIKKKQKMVVDLEESIPKLRTEIEHLQIQSFNMRERLTKDNAWFVAVEYFRVFQYGFPVLDISDTRVSNLMSSSMAPYLDSGTSYGTEALTQSWKIFTQAFPDGRVQLESLKQLTTQSLIATTITSVTLTNHALKYLFQSLAEGIGDKDERKVGISTKLLNQHIVMRGSVRFDWDETSKRVIGLFTHTDMLTPMVELVGNLEDVSLVFNGALVAPDGRFNVEKATQHQ